MVAASRALAQLCQWEFWKVKSNNTQLKDLSLELLLRRKIIKSHH